MKKYSIRHFFSLLALVVFAALFLAATPLPAPPTPTAERIMEITFSGISSTIHNADCTRFFGTVKLALWNTDAAGSKTGQIAAVSGSGTLIDFGTVPGPNRNVVNFPGNGILLPNVENIKREFKIDPALLNQDRIIIEVITDLGSAHKGCDLCFDYTSNIRMAAATSAISLKNVLAQAVMTKTIVFGPFTASDGNGHDHDIRVHFELRDKTDPPPTCIGNNGAPVLVGAKETSPCPAGCGFEQTRTCLLNVGGTKAEWSLLTGCREMAKAGEVCFNSAGTINKCCPVGHHCERLPTITKPCNRPWWCFLVLWIPSVCKCEKPLTSTEDICVPD